MYKIKIVLNSGEEVRFDVVDFEYKIIEGRIEEVCFDFGDDEKNGAFVDAKQISFMQYWDPEEEEKKSMEMLNKYMLEVARAENRVRELQNELQFYAEGGNDGGLRAKYCLERYKAKA